MPTTPSQTPPVAQDVSQTSTASIVQRLLREHRSWRSKDFPFIAHLFEQVQSAEGGQSPCLEPLRNAFHRLRAEMEGHMSREEQVLFPAILDAKTETGTEAKGFGSIRNPIGMVEQEHDWEAERLEKMREIAGDYQLPENAHEKLQVLFQELEALEAAMYAHTRLESSVLFARALAMEKKTKPAA